MAAKELYDYLSTIASDVNVTLSVKCQVDLIEIWHKDQVIHRAVDGTTERKGFSEDTVATIKIRFDVLSESDAGTILDIYHDSAKANAFENSFKFSHPDGHTYVVKFNSKLDRQHFITHRSFPTIDLIVLGRIAD